MLEGLEMGRFGIILLPLSAFVRLRTHTIGTDLNCWECIEVIMTVQYVNQTNEVGPRFNICIFSRGTADKASSLALKVDRLVTATAHYHCVHPP